MKPLTEIVAELERLDTEWMGAGARRREEIRLRTEELYRDHGERLLAAFRAGEEMRDGCGMAGHNMKPHGDCLVCSAMAAFDAAVRGDGE